MQATAATLALAVTEAPPPDLRGRILGELDHIRQEPPSQERVALLHEPTSTVGRTRWPKLAVSAAAVAAAAALIVAVVVTDVLPGLDQNERDTVHIADLLADVDTRMLEATGPDGARARLVISASRGEAVLVVGGWTTAPSDQTFQMWLIGPDGAEPAGTFGVDESGRSVQPLTGDLADIAAIGVTLEPAGGSPQPTSEPIVLIEL